MRSFWILQILYRYNILRSLDRFNQHQIIVPSIVISTKSCHTHPMSFPLEHTLMVFNFTSTWVSYTILFYVCLGIFFPFENFSLIWRHHHCWWRAANFDLCLALMAIEQWGFFSMPHLLLHRAYVYNGHLQGLVTLTPIAQRLAVELSQPVFDLGPSRLGFEHPTFSMPGELSTPLHHCRNQILIYTHDYIHVLVYFLKV